MSRPKYDTREKLQNYIDTFVSQNPTNPLYINDTGIISLEGIKFPESITYILVSNNKITSLEGVTFPSKLTTLQLGWNPLTSLDGVVFPPKLTDLQLQHNQITSLNGVAFPPGLVSLDLSNNQITSFAGMQFPLSLFSLKLAGNLIDLRTVTELKNPSPFVIREIVAAFPETGPHFQRMEEEQRNLGEKVEQLFKMLYALNMQKEGGAKSRRKTCKKMKKMKKRV